ncbi:MAG TPA: CpsD/CapB family tyrosine-protein kinase [Myxococcales bacterium]|nr:CpsD/CapB family tyrosine-protein kinase [Myxococcales bacterium]
MSSNAKAVESRSRFLERIEGGAEETTVDGRLVALTQPMGAAAEQYRMLLHRIRHVRARRAEAGVQSQGGVIVAVTSAVRGEGVSITAANLALTAARTRDARVALVDCDLRRPGQSQLFGMGARPGLGDVLSGKTEIGEALGHHQAGHLTVIGAGKSAGTDSASLLAGQRFAQTLSLLRTLFDEIFLDVPPALATADASVVSYQADGVVLVTRAGSTPREQVASAVRSLQGAPVWGLVLNGVEPSRVPAPLPVVKGQLTSGK